jgi:endonuclease-3
MKPNFRARCARVNRLLARAYGEPKWPGPQDPLEVLVRTVLSQSTNSANAESSYQALRKSFPTWDAVAAARPEAVARALRSGGLANQKARHLVKILQDLKAEHGGLSLDFIKTMSVREAMRALESLDGVGPKTAACVILFSLGREICPVDTHIHRVLQRVGIVPNTATAEAAFEILQPLVPAGQSYAFHLNLIRLGREVCKASRPRCGACPVETECRYPSKNLPRSERTA